MQDLPIGISEFSELRTQNCLYVDKTKFVYSLLTKNRRTFLSRPRRFGKSLLVSTLTAALQGKRDLFQGLWIANSDYSWKPVGIIRLDLSQLSIESGEKFKKSLFLRLQSAASRYKLVLDDELDVNSALDTLIEQLCNIEMGHPFESVAILIDEYDHPILHTLHKPEVAKEIRDILKSFSCVIKAQAERVKFVFVTGVSAFSKSGLSSGLNNLKNLTMDEDFSAICGYTDEEVDTYFKAHIEKWVELRQTPYENVRQELKTWYNGYSFKQNTPTLYSPFSLTCALDVKELKNFWFESATPQVLLDELKKEERQNECKLLEIDQSRGTGDLLQTFEIESLPLPALLFQMGYLTINSYDSLTKNYHLKYPNLEVKVSFQRHLVALLSHKTIAHINPLIGDIYSFLVQEKMDNVIEALTSIISGIPYPLHMSDEKFYHSLLQVIFSAAGIDVQSERMTSIGRMDLVLEFSHLLYIIELKVNELPEKGLHQIETQKYHEPFLFKKKKIIAVGISFLRKKASKKTRSSFALSYAAKTLP